MRVLIADDHALIVEALRLMLERIDGVKVVATAHNGREALALAREHRPDLVVMDISMPELNGIDAATQLLVEWPQARVLILSEHADEHHVHRAVRAGVRGYLLKGAMPGELPAAVVALLRGCSYLSPAIAGHVVSDFVAKYDGGAGGADPLEDLTRRQREILQMIAEGRSTKQIAFALNISVKTVETHRTSIMERLGIRDLAGLVLFSVREGLVHVARAGAL